MTTGQVAGEPDRPVNRDRHRTERIRSLNDALRQKLPRAVKGCRLNVTSGVAELHPDTLARLLDSVRTFERFTDDNDPHGEHDFGAIDQDGFRFFWKIDAFDRWMQFRSPDPTDPTVTTRVLTIMLAEEY